MNYEEFKEEITRMLRERFGDNIEFVPRQVYKTNLGKVDMLNIEDKEAEGTVCVPSVCLPEFYAWYQGGGSMEKMVLDIVDNYYQKKIKQTVFSLPDEIKDYEKVKGRVYYRLLNQKKNREMLSEAPHFDFLDLTIAFYILALEEEEGIGSILISQELLECWGILAKELRDLAVENTPKLFPAQIDTMAAVIQKMSFGEVKEKTEKPPFVVSNDKRVNGFGAILYPGILRGIADKWGKTCLLFPVVFMKPF